MQTMINLFNDFWILMIVITILLIVIGCLFTSFRESRKCETQLLKYIAEQNKIIARNNKLLDELEGAIIQNNREIYQKQQLINALQKQIG